MGGYRPPKCGAKMDTSIDVPNVSACVVQYSAYGIVYNAIAIAIISS